MQVRSEQILATVCLGVVLSSPLHAAENPNIQVNIQNTVTVYTATPADHADPNFKPHINFPYLKTFGTNGLVIEATIGQTQSGLQKGLRKYSYDGGLTWFDPTPSAPYSLPHSQVILPAGQTSVGLRQQLSAAGGATTWTGTRYTSSNAGNTWNYGTATFNSTVAYTSTYHSFNDLIPSNGNLLSLGYGTRQGSSRQELILFSSADNGATWDRRSTVASYTSSLNYGQMGTEGPSEGALVKLDNGNLLTVYRTGQPFPSATSPSATTPALFWSMSSDDGLTWTAPKTLGVEGVFPLMQKLDDGSVALTYGRYGANVMFVDPTGTRWTRPTTIYNGPGSGHTELRKTVNGNYAFVYDQSSFYPPSWNGSVPSAYVYNNDQSANLKVAILDIQQQPAQDAYPWSFEYHGDVTPSQLASPWTANISAPGGSVRLWAEYGQDYMRFDKSGNGQMNYRQEGSVAGTPWSTIDFADGLALEIRSRLTRDTSGGAITLSFGDGENGSVSLSFSGSAVTLSGNASTSYAESAHAGFSTGDWHDYLLLIEPYNGSFSARLYLDGDQSTPILSQWINASFIGDFIAFGDLTGTNNIAWDIDFLRFATLVPEPSALGIVMTAGACFMRRRRSIASRSNQP